MILPLGTKVVVPSGLICVKGFPASPLSIGLSIVASPAPPRTRSPRVAIRTTPSPGITIGPAPYVANFDTPTSGARGSRSLPTELTIVP